MINNISIVANERDIVTSISDPSAFSFALSLALLVSLTNEFSAFSKSLNIASTFFLAAIFVVDLY